MSAYDAIVVGVGAMGSSAAWHLARRGARVLGLERHGVPHALGSSAGFSRMIRLAYYEHPDYVPLLRRAYELWDELEAASGQKLLHRTGGLYMGPDDGHVVQGTMQSARQHALEHEVLSREEVAQRFPQFALPEGHLGVWEPQAGFLLPEKVIAAYAEGAMRAGAEVHGHEAVTGWSADATGVTVTTARGTYRGRSLLFCGGAWSSRLLADLGLPLTVTRQVLGWLWPMRPELFALGTMPVWGIEQGDGSLAYGFPMMPDNPGLKLARHAPGAETDPEKVCREPAEGDAEELMGIAQRYLPEGVGPVVALRVCLYTMSQDGHFVLGRHPRHGNVYVACGFSGHGFKFASVVGEVLADWATTGRTDWPVGFLEPGRLRRGEAK